MLAHCFFRRQSALESQELLQKLEAAQSELRSALDKVATAEEAEAHARRQCLEQMGASQEAQEKYERELVQHAAAVEQVPQDTQP